MSSENVRAILRPHFLPQSIKSQMTGSRYLFPFGGSNHRVDEKIQSILREKRLYISTKQVPSCLLMRAPGSYSIRKNEELLLGAGFPLEESTPVGWVEVPKTGRLDDEHHVSASQIDALSSYLSSINVENQLEEELPSSDSFEVSLDDYLKRHTSPGDYSSGSDDESDIETSVYDSTGTNTFKGTRIRYQDPFVINAALIYADEAGLPAPKVYSWGGDTKRLTDKIPARLFSSNWTGKSRRGCHIFEIRDKEEIIRLLLRNTFWGKALSRYSFDKECEEHSWAKCLAKRLKYFIRGRHDPTWTSSEVKAHYGSDKYEVRDHKRRVVRLIQVLLTIDGIFQQRYLAMPHEEWNWKKFDDFVLGMLTVLLGDEFIDGEVNEYSSEVDTAYSKLKRVRQQFKDAANKGNINELITEIINTNSFDNVLPRVFLSTYSEYREIRDRHSELRVRGILGQTRGCGTPPPLVALQTKEKFLRTVTQEPRNIDKGAKRLLRAVVQKILDQIPDSAFTGLTTKAGVRAATSACFEKTREEGGGAQAIQDIIIGGIAGHPVPKRNLVTNVIEGTVTLNECTVGEYIFWSCLEEVLCTPLEELKEVYLIVASEPGKGRSVTKGHIALRVVLDVVNAICSWPLKKVESSSSGMSREAHAWNFFRYLTDKKSELLFQPEKVEVVNSSATTSRVTEVFRQVYCLSTDYETATDFEEHEIASEQATQMMTKCGIPPVLQGIVRATCYTPRNVFFKATGFLKKYGEPVDEEVNRVRLVRGILMGDPLTKVVLHMTNMCVRELARSINDLEFLGRVTDRPSQLRDFLLSGAYNT